MQFILVAAIILLMSSWADARTFTYQLRGSLLDECFISSTPGLGIPDPGHNCTPAERVDFAPSDGYTVDGTLRIEESHVSGGSLRNTTVKFVAGSSDDALVSLDLANIGFSTIGPAVFQMTTDASRRPVSWKFQNDDMGGSPLAFQSFSGPGGGASVRFPVFVGSSDFYELGWHGRQGGTLALVPLPAAGPALLFGLIALGLLARSRPRGA